MCDEDVRPGIITPANDDDLEFPWFSDGWFSEDIRHTERGLGSFFGRLNVV